MSQCGRCGKVFREPTDEQGEHGCPRCGLPTTDDAISTLPHRLRAIAELMEDEGIGRGDWCDGPTLREAADAIECIEAMKDGFMQRLMSCERQAATHGAMQARREVQEFLRSKGHHMLAQDITESCKWGLQSP